MNDPKRERERQREKQAPRREPDVGLEPGSPGPRPGPKAGTKPLSHPGIPWIQCFTYSCVQYLLNTGQHTRKESPPQYSLQTSDMSWGLGIGLFNLTTISSSLEGRKVHFVVPIPCS